MQLLTHARLRVAVAVVAFGILSAVSAQAAAQTVISTLPEVNYLDLPAGPYPSAVLPAGSFSYTPPATITSATISGTFGNSVEPSSAGVRVFLNGTLIATCVYEAPCYTSSADPTAWSFQIPQSMFPALQSGTADLTFVQDSFGLVRLGVTRLELTNATPVPTLDPAALVAMAMLLALAGAWVGLRRRH